MASGSIRQLSGNDQYLLTPTHLRGRTLVDNGVGRSMSPMVEAPAIEFVTSTPTSSGNSSSTGSSTPSAHSSDSYVYQLKHMYGDMPLQLRGLIRLYIGDVRHLLLMTHNSMYMMAPKMRSRPHHTHVPHPRIARNSGTSGHGHGHHHRYHHHNMRVGVKMICEAEYPAPDRSSRFSSHAAAFHNGAEQVIDVPGISIAHPSKGPAIAYQTLLLGLQRETHVRMLPWPLHVPRYGVASAAITALATEDGTSTVMLPSSDASDAGAATASPDDVTLWSPTYGRLLPPLICGAVYAVVCIATTNSTLSPTAYDDGSSCWLTSGSGPAILLAVSSQMDSIAVWRLDPYASRLGWTQQIIDDRGHHHITAPRVIGGARNDWSLLSINEMYRDTRAVAHHKAWQRIYVVAPDRCACLDLRTATWLPLPVWPKSVGNTWPTVVHIARQILHVIVFAKVSGQPHAYHYMLPLAAPPTAVATAIWPAVHDNVTWQLVDGVPSTGFEGSTLVEWHGHLWLGPNNGPSSSFTAYATTSSSSSTSSLHNHNGVSTYPGNSSTNNSNSYDDSEDASSGGGGSIGNEFEQWSEQTVDEVLEEIGAEDSPRQSSPSSLLPPLPAAAISPMNLAELPKQSSSPSSVTSNDSTTTNNDSDSNEESGAQQQGDGDDDEDDDDEDEDGRSVFVRFDLDHHRWMTDRHDIMTIPSSTPDRLLARHVVAVDVAL